ncbi:MAG: gamma-glutamyl-gamma-aminobutyrate hydrolase family protein [Firmicutes bacterium]|nr:gamma-glutamyl-gamma-aminobutyrate hydrolase family protein [Bacillota bacterium]
MSSILMACGDKSGAERYYVPALRLVGWQGEIRLVSPGDEVPELERAAGLLLCGGGDVHPRLWDPDAEAHREARPDEGRDAFEAPLVRRAWEARVPMLGICRGEQMLNVALGGTLIQDIPDHFHCEDQCHRFGTAREPDLRHAVQLAPGSRLAGLFGISTFQVNSRHHQAVGRVAPCLKAVGWELGTVHAETGPLVEAVEAEDSDRWVFGVQWHPEGLVTLPNEAGRLARRLFEAFAQAVGTR